ncbi:hypothetical protein EON76_04510 [bacterium]|nr:MAG: hypothetical protein EON76_04510 [bacterium]
MNALQKLIVYIGSAAIAATSSFGVPTIVSSIGMPADTVASSLASSTETALSDNTDRSLEDATADVVTASASQIDDSYTSSDDD